MIRYLYYSIILLLISLNVCAQLKQIYLFNIKLRKTSAILSAFKISFKVLKEFLFDAERYFANILNKLKKQICCKLGVYLNKM